MAIARNVDPRNSLKKAVAASMYGFLWLVTKLVTISEVG